MRILAESDGFDLSSQVSFATVLMMWLQPTSRDQSTPQPSCFKDMRSRKHYPPQPASWQYFTRIACPSITLNRLHEDQLTTKEDFWQKCPFPSRPIGLIDQYGSTGENITLLKYLSINAKEKDQIETSRRRRRERNCPSSVHSHFWIEIVFDERMARWGTEHSSLTQRYPACSLLNFAGEKFFCPIDLFFFFRLKKKKKNLKGFSH